MLKYLEFYYSGKPNIIQVDNIWRSIGDDNAQAFRNFLITDQTIYLNLTVRKTPFTEQFDEPMKDIRVKKLYLKRWKPAHLI